MINFLKNKFRPAQTKFSFGATSAIITNLGLIIGLRTGHYAKLSIMGGIMIIALADNIADSAGIHIYQEAECLKTKEVWFSTFTNFLTRILVSLTFVFLVIFLPIKAAVACSLIWGLLLLSYLSYTIARNRKVNPYLAVFEHIAIAILVIALSNFLGTFVINKFQL